MRDDPRRDMGVILSFAGSTGGDDDHIKIHIRIRFVERAESARRRSRGGSGQRARARAVPRNYDRVRVALKNANVKIDIECLIRRPVARELRRSIRVSDGRTRRSMLSVK